MVVTYYIKPLRTGADRHNGILMSLLLVAETITQQFFSLFLRSVFEQIVKSKEILISFVKDCLPDYSIQPITGDVLCIPQSFVVGISKIVRCQMSLDEVASSLNTEFIRNRDFYEAFMEEKMKSKIESELEESLMSPLGCYGNDIVDF